MGYFEVSLLPQKKKLKYNIFQENWKYTNSGNCIENFNYKSL